MAYTVEFLETAVEELADLPPDMQRQILRRIEGLTANPRPAGVKRLKASEPFLRLRVGDHRIIYLVEGRRLVILVAKIGDRKDVYARLEVLTRRAKAWRQARGK